MPIYEHITTEPTSYEHLRGLTLQQLWDEVQVARMRLVEMQRDNERMQRDNERMQEELAAAKNQLRLLAKSIDAGLFAEVKTMTDAEEMRLRIQAFLNERGV